MAQGGQRPGAGRPAGSRNKRTVELEAKAAEAAAAISQTLAGAFSGDAHALLMSVYKDPAQPIELRLEAAGKAIRYEKPALAAVDLVMNGEIRHEIRDTPLPPEERDAAWLEKFGKPN